MAFSTRFSIINVKSWNILSQLFCVFYNNSHICDMKETLDFFIVKV